MKQKDVEFPSEKDLEQEKNSKLADNQKVATDNTANSADAQSAKNVVDKKKVQRDDDAVVLLKEQIAALEKERDDFEDKLLRAQAELQNMQTRQRKETANLLKYAGSDLAKNILPALDNLERALSIEVDDEASIQLKKGVEMTHANLLSAITEQGVVAIAEENVKFDPTKHQAVQTVPVEDGQESDQVVSILQKGYMFKDRILRPAMVVVSQ